MGVAMPSPVEGLEWQPWIFDLSRADERARLEELARRGAVWRRHDTLQQQVADLVRTRHPEWSKAPVSPARIDAAARELLGERPAEEFGRWVYFPWSGELMHLLPPAEFAELRLNRNRNKLTLADQQRLAEKTIGIVGLSVGNAVATALAIEGIGGTLKLADFDCLDLSNMNRIRASVGDISLPKTVLCARQIFEMNPYASLVLFDDGLTEENLESFFSGEPALDIVIDECDDIRLKVLLREAARARRTPVLMETSDRGMLDVERFDQEPGRQLFHGLLGDLSARDVPASLAPEDKIRFVAPIVGIDTLSTRSAASMLEIGETISTWPQLGSEVQLGGATLCAALRQLILTGDLDSGRRYIDLGELLGRVEEPPGSAGAASPGICVQEPHGLVGVSELMRYLVGHGVQAPSGGNCQPWRFLTDNETLWVVHDRARSASRLDGDGRGAYVALGAAIENLRLAALHRGYQTDIAYLPEVRPGLRGDDEVVAALRFRRVAPHEPIGDASLFPAIGRRMTDRKRYGRAWLSATQRCELIAAAAREDCRLTLLEGDTELAEIGEIVGAGDRLRILSDELHGEMMTEVRWSRREAQISRDGLDLDTLELSPSEEVAFRLIRRPEVARFLQRENGASVLTTLSDNAIRESAAVGLISVSRHDREAQLRGGQAIERLWLLATQLGLSWHPMTALIYMLDGTCPLRFPPREATALAALRDRLNHLFPVHADASQLMLFRLSVGQPTERASLRRPLEDVLFHSEGPLATEEQ